MLRWFVIAGGIVCVDQATKYLAADLLEIHVPLPVVPFFNLTLTYNTGAAFSLLSDAGGWQRWFFTFLSIAVSIFIIFWIRRTDSREFWLPFGLALVLGGAVGNLCDRLRLGAVVDFIDVHYGAWHFPAFNVADSSITVGAVRLFATAVLGKTEDG